MSNKIFLGFLSLCLFLPAAMAGKEVSFIAAVVEAGRNPGIPLSEISSTSPHMILFDKEQKTVNP